MSMYRSRRRRRDDILDVEDVLIRTDKVKVIEDDRRRKHRFHDDSDRTLVINADKVTVLADEVDFRDDDRRRRRRHHHDRCDW
ncbi:hypothetical protein [Oceanobacillus damuensis]|uniref:hypothetical protein n=1 Tax=Oceanobacillus damuensis TaxID=937928 RepID=UPI0008345E2E|nr:hypothetical protein [Oceanobacillus damuensis]